MADDDDNDNDNGPLVKKTKVGAENAQAGLSGKYNIYASNYFNADRFFREDDREIFQTKTQKFKTDETRPHVVDLRETTVQSFYEKALGTCKNDDQALRLFFSDNIAMCDNVAVLANFYQWKMDTGIESKDDWVKNPPRMVNVDFKIQSAHFSHLFDLDRFSIRIDELFKWHTEEQSKSAFVAPYFCFIQSSGMGKTKLMYEYKTNVAPLKQVKCLLLLPSADATLDEPGQVFEKIDLVNIQPDPPTGLNAASSEVSPTREDKNLEHSREVAEKIFCKLDGILMRIQGQGREAANQKIALLFDESHPLLKKEFGLEAFRFRCVRLWLLEKERQFPFHVVAVFAGTNSRFVNYFQFESDEELKNYVYPSRGPTMRTRQYYPKGKSIYLPFHMMTTMGSCLHYLKEAEQEGQSLSDYNRAVYYGRPLFAHMTKENKLDENLFQVLRRMLLVNRFTEHTWRESRRAWISLLATRVQVGQTTTELASDLVAYSYAIFCGYIEGSKAIRLGHFPDPVCARLAMCLMDEDFQMDEPNCKIGRGMEKKWWTSKLRDIYSTGIVSPERGNFGEVVVSLYMLFCGDLLRKRINMQNKFKGIQMYSQFSVSVDAWLHLMMTGGKTEGEELIDECQVSVGFIQVCRNSLRSYEKSWRSLADQSFLKFIFESGIAFYLFPSCPIIDIVIPLRITQGIDTDTEYIPMFVSIKCKEDFTNDEVIEECQRMQQSALFLDTKKALCLLVVFASNAKNDDGTNDLVLKRGDKISPLLFSQGVVSRAIRVPLDDAFELSTAFEQITPTAEMQAELQSSHTFLMAHGCNGEYHDDLMPKLALRQESRARYENEYEDLRKEMKEKSKRVDSLRWYGRTSKDHGVDRVQPLSSTSPSGSKNPSNTPTGSGSATNDNGRRLIHNRLRSVLCHRLGLPLVYACHGGDPGELKYESDYVDPNVNAVDSNVNVYNDFLKSVVEKLPKGKLKETELETKSERLYQREQRDSSQGGYRGGTGWGMGRHCSLPRK